MTSSPQPTRPLRSRDVAVAAACGVFAALMVGAAYAAVPLYDWFCRTTGFGGTTQVATAAPSETLDRTVTIRFDANVGPGLPWRFAPEQNAIQVRLGEVVTFNYIVTNQSARPTTGQAGYNVSPPISGGYFNKINCFCFTDQTLKPGETREMPVVFFVDPALVNDYDEQSMRTITLSYTMYPVREPPPAVANGKAGSAGRS